MRNRLGNSSLSTLVLVLVAASATAVFSQFGNASSNLIATSSVAASGQPLRVGTRSEAAGLGAAVRLAANTADGALDLMEAMGESRWVKPIALTKTPKKAVDPAKPTLDFGAGTNVLHDFSWTDLPIDEVHPSHLQPAFERATVEAQQMLDGIVAQDGVRTWDNTVLPYDAAYKRVSRQSTYFTNFRSLGVLEGDLKKAFDDAYPVISKFYDDNALRQDIYLAFRELRDSSEGASLSESKQRYLQKLIAEYEKNGVDLPADKQAQLQDINNRLNKLGTKFRSNVNVARDKFGIVIGGDADLSGVPAYLTERGSERAVRLKREGTIYLESEARTILNTAHDAELREEVWRSLQAMSASGDNDNRAVVSEILDLRRQKAQMLGYDNFVDYQLSTRMAQDSRTAIDFIEGLRDDVSAHYRRSGRDLRAFRRSQGGEGDLNPWDAGYWGRKYRQLKDEGGTDLRAYLEFESTTRGVMDVYEKLYGITIQPVEGARVWDDSVKLYRVEDADGSHLGSFYYDPFSRPGKNSGAWHLGVETAADAEPNVSVVATNINGADAKGPLLMSLGEVRTQFHEFGHLMHNMFSQVDVPAIGGTAVARDVVEFPSKLMEFWRFEPEVIRMFAKHHKTGEPVPKSLIDEVVAGRNDQVVDNLMYQLQLSLVDLALHRDFDLATHGDDPLRFAREASQRYNDQPLPDDYAHVTSFSHVFSGGYAAGYYGYLWSSVLAADAFYTQFKPAGAMSREVADRFRRSVLQVGGSVDEGQAYRNFAGHDPDPRWLLRSMGLEKESLPKRIAGAGKNARERVARQVKRARNAVQEEYRVWKRLR